MRMRYSLSFVGVLVFMALSVSGEEALKQGSNDTTTTNMVGADKLWADMYANGMIDEAQYQHVQEKGFLPGGSVITNSPVPVAEQSGWNRLTEHNVITAEELAGVLFNGSVPNMTLEESQAFADLAPVYRPNRAKRLTYDLRRKHARVELIRIAHHLRKEHEERTAGLEERANALDIPMERGNSVLMYIDEQDCPHYMSSLGMAACDTISTDEVWTTNAVGQVNTNFNLTGAGVTLAMWERGGINNTHPEFWDRGVNITGIGPFNHGSAVAAIMIGAGVTNNAQGMAYEASLHVYSWWKGSPAQLPYVATNDLIRFSNHSYALIDKIEEYGQHEAQALKRDKIVYEAYYHLPVASAGNTRNKVPIDYSTLVAGIAKNVLCVGAVEELVEGYTGASNVNITAYSSFGPTTDGRIKPDIVASGLSGLTPSLGGDTYSTFTDEGTSFAAAAVTGSLGLLQELHERQGGTNSIPLLASTYKGLVIHTADEAGDAPGPDYRFGWGLMNTHSAASLMTENAQWNSSPFIKEFMLPDGECASFSVEADTNQPLRVTICWSDPPRTPIGGQQGQAYNDIDLRIVDSSGQTNFPWVLIPSCPTNAATVDDNEYDNVEQVVITNTVEGAYTVVINHKDQLKDQFGVVSGQEVSIILSGHLPENIDPGIAFSFTTNGFPRLEISDVIGSVYEISRSDNLMISEGWVVVPESPLSIIHMQTEWIDPAGTTNPVRFYKINQTE